MAAWILIENQWFRLPTPLCPIVQRKCGGQEIFTYGSTYFLINRKSCSQCWIVASVNLTLFITIQNSQTCKKKKKKRQFDTYPSPCPRCQNPDPITRNSWLKFWNETNTSESVDLLETPKCSVVPSPGLQLPDFQNAIQGRILLTSPTKPYPHL